ncbi:2Fe-2S iron-sulfur cluster binding domain-containing protein [Nocardioides pocheonensis]|uniref:2Fe-2S iron-sulfur cluster binding domain-containing protein n=1 Tax=Nocardioides pocheonensis TaxID=661485 RepID=UPI001FE43554|nr:2Fe-2S iron-sulfur cluster binding domain-containing protein [Nocardioides pocheonensis]
MPFDDTFDVEPEESILKAVLRQGRYVKYGCKHGGCSTCRAHVVDGDYRLGESTSFALSDADRDAGVVLLCSTFADSGDLVVDVSKTMDDLTEEQYLAGHHVQEFTATVDRVDLLTHDIRWLGLRLNDESAMSFVAGQYVEVAVPDAPDQWRSFSMANPSMESGRVDLIVKLLPEGRFSTALDQRLKVGDQLQLRGPLGQFGVQLSHRPMVMIAGGSGMAPILAMLRDLAATGNRREVTFLYGARTARDLFLVEVLQDLARQNEWLTFIPALSEPNGDPAWNGETGLITEVLARHLPSTTGWEAYLCGPPLMIDAAVEVLTTSGCKDRHIHFDRFVPSG